MALWLEGKTLIHEVVGSSQPDYNKPCVGQSPMRIILLMSTPLRFEGTRGIPGIILSVAEERTSALNSCQTVECKGDAHLALAASEQQSEPLQNWS